MLDEFSQEMFEHLSEKQTLDLYVVVNVLDEFGQTEDGEFLNEHARILVRQLRGESLEALCKMIENPVGNLIRTHPEMYQAVVSQIMNILNGE